MHCVGKTLLFAVLSWNISESLDKHDPHVCPYHVQVKDGKELKTRLRNICCPDYYLHDEKCIECQAGTYGKYCGLGCLSGYYGIRCKNMCNCSKHTKCDPIHGCICDDGWTGMHCNKTCPFGKFGMNCSKACPCQNELGCDPISGHCKCPPGKTGHYCHHDCQFGYFGNNCSEECQCEYNCDPTTGGCYCPPGKTGSNCTAACPKGRFGLQCIEICNCVHDEGCHPETGVCICLPEWVGPNCTEVSDKAHKNHDTVDKPKTESQIEVYIVMTASITVVICVVAAAVKLKSKVWDSISSKRTDQLSPNIRRQVSINTTGDDVSIINRSINSLRVEINNGVYGDDNYCEIHEVRD